MNSKFIAALFATAALIGTTGAHAADTANPASDGLYATAEVMRNLQGSFGPSGQPQHGSAAFGKTSWAVVPMAAGLAYEWSSNLKIFGEVEALIPTWTATAPGTVISYHIGVRGSF